MGDRQAWQHMLLQKNREIQILLAKMNQLEAEAVPLNQQIAMEASRADGMRTVLDEYERVISLLYDEKARIDELIPQKIDAITRERDQQIESIRVQETLLVEFQKKFEKCQEAVKILKENKAALMETLEEHRQTIKKKEQQYKQLINFTVHLMEKANQELEVITKSQTAELARVQARLPTVELQLQELQQMLEVKERENQDLTNILDELIEETGFQ